MYGAKTVLITGSSRGIGKVLATHFLHNGADVIGIARQAHKDGRYKCYAADLSSVDDIKHAFRQITEDYLKIDIVINNAAVLTSNYAVKITDDQAKDMLAVNVLAPFVVIKESLKLMKHIPYGRIVNISSMAVPLEPMGDSLYASTKAALETMTNILAKEVAFLNITCNTLGVSAIETDMLKQLNREKVDKVVKSLPIPRYADNWDINYVIDFFCSEKASYITAQTVYLGGVHA
jgi:3-oxoacyl-[acyl-carrier protein] reductase